MHVTCQLVTATVHHEYRPKHEQTTARAQTSFGCPFAPSPDALEAQRQEQHSWIDGGAIVSGSHLSASFPYFVTTACSLLCPPSVFSVFPDKAVSGATEHASCHICQVPVRTGAVRAHTSIHCMDSRHFRRYTTEALMLDRAPSWWT